MAEVSDREVIQFKIIEVAKILGVSKVTVYKRLRSHREFLEGHVFVRSGVQYVDQEGLERLREIITGGRPTFSEGDAIAIEEMRKIMDSLSAAIEDRKEILKQKDIQLTEYALLIDKKKAGRN